jgi:dTDP-4-amino-4,6-dideoxygalactose transaminase
MGKYKYNSWPLGKLPKEFQRPEPELIRELGYEWDDPRDIVDIFERKVAKWAGSEYAIATDCCSNAIFLCLQYYKTFHWWEDDFVPQVKIPKRTYISVPMQIIHAGFKVVFDDREWSGIYRLEPTNIWDAAVRWTKDMYIPNSLMCLSFQIKKKVPIGRGGMILTDNKLAHTWLKLASYDGRDLTTPYTEKDHFKMIGWHTYMTPEDAARGIILMDQIPEINPDWGGDINYIDTSKIIKKLTS